MDQSLVLIRRARCQCLSDPLFELLYGGGSREARKPQGTHAA